MVSSRLFTQATGTAIATELLYRILFDIINRLIGSLQRLAVKGFDEGTSLLERKLQERRDRIAAAKEEAENGSKIVEEVSKLAEESGFICPATGRKFDNCPTGRRGPPGPPMWVRGVLEGLNEGRMQPRDFWIQTHEG